MKSILSLFFCLFTLAATAQRDTEFWFAAPDVDVQHQAPIVLRITSYSTASNVTVSMPANPAFAPINVSVPANSSISVDLTTWLNSIENSIPNVVANKGLVITATTDISVYYEAVSVSPSCPGCNPELFALKGKNAIGTEFIIPTQTTWAIDTVRYPSARSAFDIVATEDNTIITITPSKPLMGRPSGVPFAVTLNKGQTFSNQGLYRNKENMLNGSTVTSSKPIAITEKEDLLFADGACADLTGDQLVPVAIWGDEFIVIKGDLLNRDRVVVTAAFDNTAIFLDGSSTAIAVINKNTSYEFDLVSAANVYIKSTNKVSVSHYTGVNCENSSAIIPKLTCTGSSEVSIVKSIDETAIVFVVTKAGNESGFLVNGNPGILTAADFSIVAGAPGYVFCKKEIGYGMPLASATRITNSAGLFQLGFLNGSFPTTQTGCRYGYFSDFKSSNVQRSQTTVCRYDSAQLNAFGGISYQWFPSIGLSNPSIPDPKASPAVTTEYKVVITTAEGCIDSAFVKVEVDLGCANAIVKPSFEIPSSVCVNTPVTIVNTSENASSYFWSFCGAGTNTTPVGSNLGNIGGALQTPVFIDYVKFNGNHYGFVINHVTGSLVRLDFGNSLLNTPTAVNIGNAGVIPRQAEGIQVANTNGRWYAIIVGGSAADGSGPRIVKLDFGPDLRNSSPIGTDWGNIGGLIFPGDLHLFNDNGNWYGLVSDINNSIKRFSFGTSFQNPPIATDLGNIGNLSTPNGIYAVNDNGQWHVFISSRNSSSISRLDFGNSLLNIPTGVNLGNPGGLLNLPRDISIMKSCGEIVGFVVNEGSNSLVKLDFPSLTTSPVATSLGNAGNFSFPHSISKVFREGNDIYAFILNVSNNTLSRIRFEGCSNSSVLNSSADTPPSIIYQVPGIYNISLTVDDGLPTQATFCKQIEVTGPVISISNDTLICKNNSIPLFVHGGISYNWVPDPSLSDPLSSNPIVSPQSDMTYYVTVSDANCSIKDSVKVFLHPDPVFAVSPSTKICEGDTVKLVASGGDIYNWLPDPSLSNFSVASPFAYPSVSTQYTVQISETTCNNSVTKTINIQVNPPPLVKAVKSNDIDCTIGEAQLRATGATQYSWTPASTLKNPVTASPLATPEKSTVYKVKGIDNNGCANYDSVLVKVDSTNRSAYLVPNAFTPNNDGINDCFGIKFWGVIQNFDFTIYNRWGERVFQTNDPYKCWDGKYKGLPQASGAFVYMIRAKTNCDSDVFRKGTFVLIR